MVRTKIGRFYVERNRDRATKARRIVKSGYGGKGDLARKLARNVFRI